MQKAYSPEDFKRSGYSLVNMLAEHLEACLSENKSQVINWKPPEKEYSFWKSFLDSGSNDKLFSTILDHTINLHHPRYMGHQISPVAPLTSLTGLLSAFVNNGMGIYEMGAGPTAIEKVVIEVLCQKFGFPETADGFLTSGGTLANLTALLSARRAMVKEDIWQEGSSKTLGIMVSEEAHYCIDRASRIMGLGDKGIIKVPVTENFQLNKDHLESLYHQALKDRIKVFAIVGSAPSTATGIYDPLDPIRQFAEDKGIWFHVDAAHGGAAIFSPKYSHLLDGVQGADSIVIDGHKMMMMPSITTALLFRNGKNSHETFKQKASYLLEESADEDWYNLAKRTFECTKYMMSLHWFALMKVFGNEIFDEFVTTLYDLGTKLAELVRSNPKLELAVVPMSNIVCFRYKHENSSLEELNMLNSRLRQQLLEEGKFYVVQTRIKGKQYLRTTLMNPFTTEEHLKGLLSRVVKTAESIRNSN